MVNRSDTDKMFDDLQQKGLDELQKFFDGGGKLDFSEELSVDEIADAVSSAYEKKFGKKKLVWVEGEFGHFEFVGGDDG